MSRVPRTTQRSSATTTRSCCAEGILIAVGTYPACEPDRQVALAHRGLARLRIRGTASQSDQRSVYLLAGVRCAVNLSLPVRQLEVPAPSPLPIMLPASSWASENTPTTRF